MGVTRKFRPSLLALVVFTAVLVAPAGASAQGTIGGPVILGGDDLTSHGSFNTTTNENEDGWLYIQRSIENIRPNVQRANDGHIAALGSADSSSPSGGDAGAAIHFGAQEAGVPVQYFNGSAAINQFFTDLANGTQKPLMIWIAGDDASNDIDSCSGAGTEGQALTDNASAIDGFVNSGGGLMSHGVCYDWLSALLPSVTTVSGGSSGDLYKTPEGETAFPDVTNDNFNAGPWHNYFEGDFGGLDVLVRSSNRQDSSQNDAAVVLGGAGVSLTQRSTDLAITKSDSPDPVQVGADLTYTLTVRNLGPEEATGVAVVDDLPGSVQFVSASASQGSCSGAGPVNCSLGTIANGGSAQVTIVVRPQQAGTITNAARVGGQQPDPNDANNSASAETTVQPASLPAATVAADETDPRIGASRAPTRCRRSGIHTTRFSVRDASAISNSAIYLDGRRVRITKRARFTYRVRVTRLRAGNHRITVRTADAAGNRSSRMVRFSVCAARRVAPAFTG